MSNLPAFDPPYQPISPALGKALLAFEANGGGASASTDKSGKQDVFFLVVPFAQKDEVKALGARWDAAARKWYVPAGKEKDAFKRWWKPA